MHLESEPAPTIGIATSDAEILDCFPVMSQLRPHLVEAEFVTRIQRQIQSAGYVLALLQHGGVVQSVAGFRISECLYSGRYLYVDDLATNANARSKGYGGCLFDWLVEHARKNQCDVLTLDSGVQRFGAHRFYLTKRMEITCHHFSVSVR
jgi:GNAT superfamily N-acetyltransferase